MGWDGMRWGGMEWDGMGWDGACDFLQVETSCHAEVQVLELGQLLGEVGVQLVEANELVHLLRLLLVSLCGRIAPVDQLCDV